MARVRNGLRVRLRSRVEVRRRREVRRVPADERHDEHEQEQGKDEFDHEDLPQTKRRDIEEDSLPWASMEGITPDGIPRNAESESKLRGGFHPVFPVPRIFPMKTIATKKMAPMMGRAMSAETSGGAPGTLRIDANAEKKMPTLPKNQTRTANPNTTPFPMSKPNFTRGSTSRESWQPTSHVLPQEIPPPRSTCVSSSM